MSFRESYLTFTVGGRQCAIAGSRVIEVLRLEEAGSVATFDLRPFFGDPSPEDHHRRCVIVVRIGMQAIGLVADDAVDVVTFSSAELVAVPSFGARIAIPYLAALARSGGALTLVLSVDQLLSAGESDTLMNREVAV